MGGRRYTQAEKEEAIAIYTTGGTWLRRLVDLHRSGVSMNEIGRQLGVNSGTVHYHLQRIQQNRSLDGNYDDVDIRVVARISGV